MTSNTHRPTQRRSQSKHELIIRAATDLAAEVGYENCTIEKLAARAGVGKQTIYRWWPSKAALYVEVYHHLVPTSRVAEFEGTSYEYLHRFLCRLFRQYKSTAAGKILVGLIAESTHNKPAAEAIEEGLFLGRSHLLSEPIQQGIVAGEFAKDLNVDFAIEVIVALIWRRLIASPAGLTASFSRSVLDIALRPRQS